MKKLNPYRSTDTFKRRRTLDPVEPIHHNSQSTIVFNFPKQRSSSKDLESCEQRVYKEILRA